MNVDFSEFLNKYIVRGSYEELEALRRIPNRKYDKDSATWIAGLTKANTQYLLSVAHQHFTLEAARVSQQVLEGNLFKQGELPRQFHFRTEPMGHQKIPLLRMQAGNAYALFMDPGTGKTKVLIDAVNAAAMKDEVKCGVVLCPNSVKSNWAEELEKHSSMAFSYFIYSPEKKRKAEEFSLLKTGAVKWFIMGIESLSNGSADVCLEHFLSVNSCALILDESDSISAHKAVRTKKAHKLARLAAKRWIATGTPLSKGIHNCWSQYEFLDPGILDCGYYAFVAHYCIKGGFRGKQIVANCNEPEFIDLVAPYTFRISKAECLDLPPKTYCQRRVQPTLEMSAVYDALNRTGAILQGSKVLMSYSNVLVRDLRLQQITGGFITPDRDWTATVKLDDPDYEVEPPHSQPIPGPNPKLEDLLGYVAQISEKAIIWCRFIPEVEMITEALRREYGHGSTVQFSGAVKEDDRTLARNRFQSDPDCRFFVGQIATGGIGITLTAASYELYFSNSWSLRHRVQSEDRAHRVGQTKNVTYVDFLIDEKWVDSKVLKALQDGKNYTDIIMQEVREATK